MQCVEHLAAQRIANLRVQKSKNAPFLPSENRFSKMQSRLRSAKLKQVWLCSRWHEIS